MHLLEQRVCSTLIFSTYSNPLSFRNDKYSQKVFKYFVEYSDKESVKKTRLELERETTTHEAWNMVCSSN